MGEYASPTITHVCHGHTYFHGSSHFCSTGTPSGGDAVRFQFRIHRIATNTTTLRGGSRRAGNTIPDFKKSLYKIQCFKDTARKKDQSRKACEEKRARKEERKGVIRIFVR